MHALHAKVEATDCPPVGRWGRAHGGPTVGQWCARWHFRRHAFHVGPILLAVTMPCLLALVWFRGDTLHADDKALQERQRALTQLETMLDGVHAAADGAMPLVEGRCADVIDALRVRAAVVPQVRSLLLAREGVVYCSTLFGDVSASPESFWPNHEALALIDGNAVTPDRPLLLYRSTQGSQQVIAVVDALNVWQGGAAEDAAGRMTWRVADMQIGSDGRLQPGRAGQMNDASVTASSRYPMAVASTSFAGRPALSGSLFRVPILLALLAGIPAGYLAHLFLQRRHGLPTELERAIQKGEFIPYYQPLVHAADMEWAGLEVLARWGHPSRGLLTPDSFMPSLERTDLILPMTAQLMEQAAVELADMLPLLPASFHVSFNITPAHLTGRWLPEQCQRFLAAFPPGRISLVLELTEREAVDADAAVHAVLDEVRRMGVRIALDDFGVGHSNLGHLQELRADRLKIDRGFVARLVAPGRMTPILRTILDLAERMDLDVVAEGVETWTQADALARHGVTLLQGYLFARPLASADLASVLVRPPGPRRARGEGVLADSQVADPEREIHT